MLKINNNAILKRINAMDEYINSYKNKEVSKKRVLTWLENISDSFIDLVYFTDDSTKEWEALNDLSDSLDILIGRIKKDEDISSIRKVLNEEVEVLKELIS